MTRIWMAGQRIIGWASDRVAEGPDLLWQRKDDHGEILQTVVIIAMFVAAAIIIVGVIVVKARSAADSIQTQ